MQRRMSSENTRVRKATFGGFLERRKAAAHRLSRGLFGVGGFGHVARIVGDSFRSAAINSRPHGLSGSFDARRPPTKGILKPSTTYKAGANVCHRTTRR